MTPQEIAEEVAGLIADRIGEACSARGDVELDGLVADDAHNEGATAFIELSDGSSVWCHCVVHPPAVDIPPR